MSDALNVYDAMPYPTAPLPQTHPDRLAVIGTLFGMTPAPATACRVLELGCGNGLNLISMACELPNSSFVGIDLSRDAVERGTQRIHELGLSNIRLIEADLLQWEPEGEFDYIIAHGFYSWVPPEVRDAAVRLYGARLTPNGIGYISYNALPGFHIRRVLREMMFHHTAGIDAPRAKTDAAVEFLRFLAQGHVKADEFGAILKSELDGLLHEKRDRAVLYHDDLSRFNEPFYVRDFVQHITPHGLQFLGEADFFEMQTFTYPPEVAAKLKQYAHEDFLKKEQYLDFLKVRRFRQSLVCRSEVPLHREPTSDLLERFCLASNVVQADGKAADLRQGVLERFKAPKGSSIRVDHAPSKRALMHLSSIWPQAIPYAELVERARDRNTTEDDLAAMREILFAAFNSGIINLYLTPPRTISQVPDRPIVSPLVRRQAARGESILSSLLHEGIHVDDPIGRHLLWLMDGSRNRASLIEELTKYIAARQGVPPDTIRKQVIDQFEPSLKMLMKLGLVSG